MAPMFVTALQVVLVLLLLAIALTAVAFWHGHWLRRRGTEKGVASDPDRVYEQNEQQRESERESEAHHSS